MLETSLDATETKVNHSLDEIRGANSTRKTLRVRMRELRRLNHALTNVIEATDPDWQSICNNTYQTLLAVVHTNGQGGSLLS